MESTLTSQNSIHLEEGPAGATEKEPRWDLGFLGILAYLVIEYTRLAAMYPILQPLELGKVAIAFATLGLLLAKRTPKSKGKGGGSIDVNLSLFLLASILSAMFAGAQSLAWLQVLNTAQWCIIYFLIARILSWRWRLRIFVLILVLLDLKLAQFGIRGYFSGVSYGRDAAFMASHGVGAGSTGFFANPGDYGVAMCVAWPLAGMLMVGEAKKIARLVFLGTFAAVSGAILVCGSRGAVLGAAITAFVAVASNWRRIGVALLFLILVPFLFFLLPEGSKDRLRSALNWEHDKTASLRIDLWRGGLRMFSDHPLLGVGPGNFIVEYPEHYAGPVDDPEKWVPHSIYIQTLSELGLVGTTALALLVISFFLLNRRTLRVCRAGGLEGQREFAFRLARGLNLAMIGYLVSGGFLAVLYYPHLYILMGLSVAAHSSASRATSDVMASQVLVESGSPLWDQSAEGSS